MSFQPTYFESKLVLYTFSMVWWMKNMELIILLQNRNTGINVNDIQNAKLLYTFAFQYFFLQVEGKNSFIRFL